MPPGTRTGQVGAFAHTGEERRLVGCWTGGGLGAGQVLVELLRLVEEVPAQCKAAGLVCGQASGSIPTSAKI